MDKNPCTTNCDQITSATNDEDGQIPFAIDLRLDQHEDDRELFTVTAVISQRIDEKSTETDPMCERETLRTKKLAELPRLINGCFALAKHRSGATKSDAQQARTTGHH